MKWIRKIRLAIILGALMGAAVAMPTFADTQKDIEAIAGAVGFIAGGPSGRVDMAIVYDPEEPKSVAHAEEIVALTKEGVGSRVKLTGAKVPLSNIDSITSSIIFLTRDSNRAYDKALYQAINNKGLTVSTDESCLGQGCILVVQTKPNVDILVSTEIAARAGVHFSSVFSMMIKKR